VFERGEGFELKRVGDEGRRRGRADAFEQLADGARARRAPGDV
jgi:hypothetical protein